MRSNYCRLMIALFLLVTLLALPEPVPGVGAEPGEPRSPVGEPGSFKAGEILVRFKDEVATQTTASTLQRYSATQIRTLYNSDVQLLSVPEGRELEIVAALNADPTVVYAEPNYVYHASITPNDPGYTNQWAHPIIHSPTAWDLTTGSTGIIIAIIDSGIDGSHPDLAGKILAGYDFWDYDSTPQDENGHGTHVAGIAAAISNNGVGVAGTAWGAQIMPVRVLNNEGSGYNSDIVDGINWASAHGAKILNLSLGGTGYSQSMQDAVNNAHAAGKLVVAAMGNCRYASSSCPTANPTAYPAAYSNVMAVAATNVWDTYTSYSQYGPHCDIAAPGGEMSYYHDSHGIYSTMPTYAVYLTSHYGYSQNYDYLQGTSQATPYVSGLAALIWSAKPGLTPDEVQAVIENTAVDLGAAGWDSTYGHGRIDALAALQSVSTPNAPVLNAIVNPEKDGNYLVDWEPATTATSYTLQEDDNPGFSSPTSLYTGGNTQYTVSGQVAGVWYYRVRASNANGDSAWSSTQSAGVVPNAPVLSTITNPGHADAYQVTWSSVSGATGYRLQEDNNALFTSPMTRYVGSALYYDVTGQETGIWYYRVQASNSVGYGASSNTVSTTVAAHAYSAPTLDAIDNDDNDGDYTVSWSSVTGVTTYTLEESHGPYFDHPSLVYTGGETSHDVTAQPYGVWYYRVRASEPSGNSAWSNVQSAARTSHIYLPLIIRNYSTGIY